MDARRGAIVLSFGLVLGLLLLELTGCKKPKIVDIAPPITRGKCVVDHYEGATATKQVCTMDGYTWSCSIANCDRTGEAVGERILPGLAP